MRVGIIAANNIRYSPYIFFYTKILDSINVDYELIYPNRMNIEDPFAACTHILEWRNSIPTALAYFDYIKKVIFVLKEEKYDLLIVLTTNNAVYLAGWLKKHFAKRYILDIRDYTHENVPIYYFLEKIAINNSLLNIISSKGFRNFLPQSNYLICHNMGSAKLDVVPVVKKEDPIRIGYIGKGGYINQAIKICEKVRSDARFQFLFYGLPVIPPELEEYQIYDNIHFNGIFMPSEKESIISGIDILFNVYGNGIPLLDYALSNKLYDALVYGKAILTSPNTYMSKIAGPYAFDVDFKKDSFLDDLYSWYMNLNKETLKAYSIKKIKEFEDESGHTEEMIIKAIMEIK